MYAQKILGTPEKILNSDLFFILPDAVNDKDQSENRAD